MEVFNIINYKFIKKRIMKTEKIEMIVVSIVFVLAFVLSGIYNR